MCRAVPCLGLCRAVPCRALCRAVPCLVPCRALCRALCRAVPSAVPCLVPCRAGLLKTPGVAYAVGVIIGSHAAALPHGNVCGRPWWSGTADIPGGEVRSGREHRPWWSTPPSAAWYEVTPLPRQVRSGQIIGGSVLLGEGASALVVDAPLTRPPKRNTAERGIGLGGRRSIPRRR